MVSRYIEFHYGPDHLDVKNFQVACVEHAVKHLGDGKTERALDIGCAAGRSSFELARYFDHVDAVDFSVRLVEAPTNLQQTGRQRYVFPEEGELNSLHEVRLDEFAGYTQAKDKINFAQDDACNLIAKYKDYDLVYALNLLDRLYDPAKFHRRDFSFGFALHVARGVHSA